MDSRVEAIEDTGTLRRPDNSAIVSEKIEPLRPWKEALAEYLESKRG
jgi:dTDP-4-dehydrorhamnose reductase